jgi:hypothetical protein
MLLEVPALNTASLPFGSTIVTVYTVFEPAAAMILRLADLLLLRRTVGEHKWECAAPSTLADAICMLMGQLRLRVR